MSKLLESKLAGAVRTDRTAVGQVPGGVSSAFKEAVSGVLFENSRESLQPLVTISGIGAGLRPPAVERIRRELSGVIEAKPSLGAGAAYLARFRGQTVAGEAA
jgi:hypothetical protein